MNEDFLDMLAALAEADVRFIIVGAHAMAVHGVPRATGDLDIWIEPTPENAERVWKALERFGAPVDSLDLTEADLVKPDLVIQIGLPPRRIDLLTGITGVDFASAWPSRLIQTVASTEVAFLDRQSLMNNKRATGRAKDLADLEVLERQEEQ